MHISSCPTCRDKRFTDCNRRDTIIQQLQEDRSEASVPGCPNWYLKSPVFSKICMRWLLVSATTMSSSMPRQKPCGELNCPFPGPSWPNLLLTITYFTYASTVMSHYNKTLRYQKQLHRQALSVVKAKIILQIINNGAIWSAIITSWE